jgi:hypothetical protein
MSGGALVAGEIVVEEGSDEEDRQVDAEERPDDAAKPAIAREGSDQFRFPTAILPSHGFGPR